MQSLVSLELRYNNLEGKIPNNELTSEFPDCWNNLTSLHFVDLSNNKLWGEILLTLLTLRLWF